MGMRLHALVLPVLLLGAGCTVDIADYAGRACDDTHGCLDGWTCQAEQCVQGGADSGTGTQRGCVRWHQTDGFASTAACPTCTLSVDSTQQNQLTAIIQGAEDGSDNASALVAASTLDGIGAGGKLRGHLYVPAGLRLEDESTFLELRTSLGAPLLELYLTHNWELGFNSAAGMLQPSSSNAESVVRLDPGTAYLIEAQWKRGGFVRLFVNRAIAAERTLAPPTGEASPPNVSELRLGIVRYAGDAQEGWTAVLSDWTLCDDPDAELAP